MSSAIGTESVVQESLAQCIAVQQAMLSSREFVRAVEDAVETIAKAVRKEGRVLLAGNGASATCARHIAADLLGHPQTERRAIPAMALDENTSAATASGTDMGYDKVFSRQVEAFGRSGDVLIAISASGNSRNVLRAVLMASALRMKTIGWTGRSGGKLKNTVDLCLNIPSQETSRIHEAHLVLGHVIAAAVEAEIFRR
jgi:D-sedoheptulose 7-phosphate isomerase